MVGGDFLVCLLVFGVFVFCVCTLVFACAIRVSCGVGIISLDMCFAVSLWF